MKSEVTTAQVPSTMSTAEIAEEVIQRKLAIALIEKRFKPLVDELKIRADIAMASSGELKWSYANNMGLSVVVTQPAPKRIALDDPAAMKKLCGEHFNELFAREVTYTALKGFEVEAEELLPKTRAQTVIGLATEISALRMNFELKGAQ